MTIKAFLEVVEAKTKLASMLPCLVGLGFSLAYFHQVNGLNSLLFFVALLCIDMATTAINNLMDYQHAATKDYQTNTNVIGRRYLNPQTVLNLIVALLFAALVLGLWLVWRTQWDLLHVWADPAESFAIRGSVLWGHDGFRDPVFNGVCQRVAAKLCDSDLAMAGFICVRQLGRAGHFGVGVCDADGDDCQCDVGQ